MQVKQESLFWKMIKKYVNSEKLEQYKNMNSLEKKEIHQIFKISYFGVFQFEIFKEETLQSISPEIVEEFTKYIIKNYDAIFKIIYHQKEDEYFFDLNNFDHKQKIAKIVEELVIPFINDNSFIDVDKIPKNPNSIWTILVQLTFKNKYDINNFNHQEFVNGKKISSIYPFLLTLLIVDITNVEEMYKRVKFFYKKEEILKSVLNGRELTDEENEFIKPILQLLSSDDDFHHFLLNFKFEEWIKKNNNSKLKTLYQLSKITSIILKNKIQNLTALFSDEQIFELFDNYSSLFFANSISNELPLEKQKNKLESEQDNGGVTKKILAPFLNYDYNFDITLEYYQDLNQIEFSDEFKIKKLSFISSILYVYSYLGLIYQSKKEFDIISDFFIEMKKSSLVDTCNIFIKQDEKYEWRIKFYWIENLFIKQKDIEIIKELSKPFEVLKDQENKITLMLKTISSILALDPTIAKKFNYSWETLVEYYLIIFSNYENETKKIQNEWLHIIIGNIRKIIKEYDRIFDENVYPYEYAESIYLIYRLQNFKK